MYDNSIANSRSDIQFQYVGTDVTISNSIDTSVGYDWECESCYIQQVDTV